MPLSTPPPAGPRDLTTIALAPLSKTQAENTSDSSFSQLWNIREMYNPQQIVQISLTQSLEHFFVMYSHQRNAWQCSHVNHHQLFGSPLLM